MGYRGKQEEQGKARRMRAEGRTLADIAATLGVSKSSVSLWVRDVDFTPSPRRSGPQRRPHPFHERKLQEIAELDELGRQRLGVLGDDAIPAAGVALYAGEGAKTGGAVKFVNSDPAMIAMFCAWLRRYFDVDERRLRAHVYLHHGLDLAAAEAHWSRSPASRPHSSVPRTAQSPTRASGGRSTNTAVCPLSTHVPALIGRSWGWSGRYYLPAPFRG